VSAGVTVANFHRSRQHPYRLLLCLVDLGGPLALTRALAAQGIGQLIDQHRASQDAAVELGEVTVVGPVGLATAAWAHDHCAEPRALAFQGQLQTRLLGLAPVRVGAGHRHRRRPQKHCQVVTGEPQRLREGAGFQRSLKWQEHAHNRPIA
jgi:hypothetical protein